MPAYNAQRYIARAIDSVLRQTYTNIELLIADDGSKDNTKKIIDAINDPRIKRFHNPKNTGYLKTCNKLLALSTGNFIAFQDADDFTSLNRLELQMNELNENPNLGVCGTNLTYYDAEGNALCCSHFLIEHEEILKAMQQGDYAFSPNSFLFRREVLDEIGGYNEYFDRRGAEDYYWTCLIMEKYRLRNIKTPAYYYTNNPNSIAGNWSDNPKKIHTAALTLYLISERGKTGTDPLAEKRYDVLNAYEEKLNEPYAKDPSLFYSKLAEKYAYEGRKELALKLAAKAIGKNSFKLFNYRLFFYILLKY